MASVLLVYSFERLPLQEGGVAQIFSLSWISFAVVVILGNLYGLLHKKKQNAETSVTVDMKKVKTRSYGR